MAMRVKPLESEEPGLSASIPFSLKKKPALSLVSKTEDELFRERLIAQLERDLNPQPTGPTFQVVPVKADLAKDLAPAQTLCVELQAWLASYNFENMDPLVCLLDVDGCAEIYRKRTEGSQCSRVNSSKPTVPSRPPDWSDHVSEQTEGWWGLRPPSAEQLILYSKQIGARIDKKVINLDDFTGMRRLTACVKKLEEAANEPHWSTYYSEEDNPAKYAEKYEVASYADYRERSRLTAWLYDHDEEYNPDLITSGLGKFFSDLKVPQDIPEAFETMTRRELDIRLEWMELNNPSVAREGDSLVTEENEPRPTLSQKQRWDAAALEAKRLQQGKITADQYRRTLRHLGFNVLMKDVIAVGTPITLHQHTFDNVREEVQAAYDARTEQLADEFDEIPWEEQSDADFRESLASRLTLIEAVEDCINKGVNRLIFPLTQFVTKAVEKEVVKRMGSNESVPKGYFTADCGIIIPYRMK